MLDENKTHHLETNLALANSNHFVKRGDESPDGLEARNRQDSVNTKPARTLMYTYMLSMNF